MNADGATVVEGSFATEASEDTSTNKNSTEAPDEEVHELFRVYLSRADIPSAAEANAQVQEASQVDQQQSEQLMPTVCVSQSSYYALITATTLFVSLFAAAILVALCVVRGGKSKFAMAGVNCFSD